MYVPCFVLFLVFGGTSTLLWLAKSVLQTPRRKAVCPVIVRTVHRRVPGIQIAIPCVRGTVRRRSPDVCVRQTIVERRTISIAVTSQALIIIAPLFYFSMCNTAERKRIAIRLIPEKFLFSRGLLN